MGCNRSRRKRLSECRLTSGQPASASQLLFKRSGAYNDEQRIFVVADLTQQKLAECAALHNERLAATGLMANTIAHEINNPLEAITNLLFILRGLVTDSESASEYLGATEKEVARVSRIARQILSFHRDTASPISVNISALLEDVLALNNRGIEEKHLRVRQEGDRTISVNGFPAQLRQVFSNLVRNAIEASEDGMEIRIKVSHASLGPTARNRLLVLRSVTVASAFPPRICNESSMLFLRQKN